MSRIEFSPAQKSRRVDLHLIFNLSFPEKDTIHVNLRISGTHSARGIFRGRSRSRNGRDKKDGSQKQASLKARGINDTSARPLASLIKRKEIFLALKSQRKKETRERKGERGRKGEHGEKRSGNTAEPRGWNLLLASGSILGVAFHAVG